MREAGYGVTIMECFYRLRRYGGRFAEAFELFIDAYRRLCLRYAGI